MIVVGTEHRQWRLAQWSGARCGAVALAVFAMALPHYSVAAEVGRVQLAQAAAPPAAAKAKPKAEAADGSLARRVEQLEEQLVDIQVTIGTLESLSRSGGGGGRASGLSSGGGGSAADAARIEGMETQIRALSAEVQRLTREIKQMGGSDRGDIATPPRFASEPAPRQPAPRVEPSTTIGGFGSTTVRPEADPIGTLIEGAPREAPPSPATAPFGRETEVAALPPAGAGNPKQDYEAAYGHLLRQDYGAAEVAFEEFLQRYPNDPLAGNAQYWLGETHFVRGNFKPAAAAFLKGYQNFAKGNKAPDSLLKLAMSLDRLGQKDAACSSFRELNAKFPQAPAHVKGRADGEMKRLNCS